MTHDDDADVAIVGYGPTGITAALTLAKAGMRVVAFERDKDIYPRARAVTVNDWTMRIFQALGIDDRVEALIEPQTALRWLSYGGHEIMRIEHPPSTLGTRNTRPRFYNIYQPTLEAELRNCGEEYRDQLTVHYGWEVTDLEQDDDGVTITSTNRATGDVRSTLAKYVIGADGGSSTTRHLIGGSLEGDTVDTQWIVIDCRVKRWWPDRDLLTFWTDARRPVVDIALSAGNHRWEIPLEPTESETDYQTEEQVWPLLNALGKTVDDVDIHQWAFYRHHVRMADTWRSGRLFLAGDAAHLMPPWAGAGMQSGMRDAYNLGWKLARVLKGELPEAWLDTYETERRPNVEFYTSLAVGLGRVIKQQATAEEIEAMNRIPENSVTPWEPPLNAPPTLVAGWISPETGDASIVGRYLPQPLMSDAMGRMARLDELLGDNFVILGRNIDPTSLLSAAERSRWDALGTRYIAVRPRDAFSEADTDLIDIEGKVLEFMDRYGVTAMAVRPDKFIAVSDKQRLVVPAL